MVHLLQRNVAFQLINTYLYKLDVFICVCALQTELSEIIGC